MYRIQFLIFLFTYNVCAQFIGPAYVDLQRLERCDENRKGIEMNISISKFNRTHKGINLYAVATKVAMDETVSANLTVSKWGDGGWKPHFYDIFVENACENLMMKYFKSRAIKILKILNLKTEKCPIPPGIYDLRNYVYSGEVDVPIMYAYFKVEMRFKAADEFMSCVRFYVKTTPKI